MADISPQDRYVRVDSINTRYRIQGAGSPVVLIHGIGSSLEDWDLNFAPLAEHHCVWALDLVGNGRSDKPAAPYTIAYFSNFVRDFLGARPRPGQPGGQFPRRHRHTRLRYPSPGVPNRH